MATSTATVRKTNLRRHRAIAQTSLRLPLAELIANVDHVMSTMVEDWGQDVTGFHADWYGRWHSILADLAAETGFTLETTVGVFAALSPSTDVDRNLELARTMLATDDCRHAYGDAIRKARAIRNGGDPADVLGGNKVRSFYRNLMSGGGHGAVTVDRHAISIAFGAPLTDRFAKVLARPGAYTLLAAAYRSVGRRWGMTGAEVQAATWCYWRETFAAGPGTPIAEYSLSQPFTPTAA